MTSIPVRVKDKVMRLPASLTLAEARTYALLLADFENTVARGDRKAATEIATKLIAAGFEHPSPSTTPPAAGK